VKKLLARSATQHVHLLHGIEARDCVLVLCVRRRILPVCLCVVKIRCSHQGGPLAAIFVSMITVPSGEASAGSTRLTRSRLHMTCLTRFKCIKVQPGAIGAGLTLGIPASPAIHRKPSALGLHLAAARPAPSKAGTVWKSTSVTMWSVFFLCMQKLTVTAV